MGQFNVSFERKYNAGAYSSLGMSAFWTWSVPDDATPEDVKLQAVQYSLFVQKFVLGELAKSRNSQVRHAAEFDLTGRRPEPRIFAGAPPESSDFDEDDR